MKLVDILAVELKRWPEFLGDAVGQAGDGTLHNEIEPEDVEISRTLESYTLCKNFISDIVTRAEWQAAVDALNAPKVVEWDGVGLPPVGEKVEVILKDSTLPASLQGWKSGDIVECVAHVGLYGMLSPLFLNRAPFLFSTLRNDCYRTIRTAAKVAAEEREKARTEVLNAMTKVKNEYEPEALWKFRLKVVGEMLDMGYRKQVAK